MANLVSKIIQRAFKQSVAMPVRRNIIQMDEILWRHSHGSTGTEKLSGQTFWRSRDLNFSRKECHRGDKQNQRERSVPFFRRNPLYLLNRYEGF